MRAYLCAIDGPAIGSLDHTARLYQSVDGAVTWTLIPHTPVMRPVPTSNQVPMIPMCAVYVDASDARDVFFQQTQFQPMGAGYAVARALYRSRDGGATWTTLRELERTNGFATIAVVGSRLIAQFEPSVYGAAPCDPKAPIPQPSSQIVASDDGGQTWRPAGQSVMAARYSASGLFTAGAALFASAYHIPTASCQGPPGAALWRSLDAGATWTRVASAPAIESATFTPKASASGYYGVAVATTADRQSTTLLFSSDNGATWAALPALPAPTTRNQPEYYAAVVTPTGDVVAQANFATTTLILHQSAAPPAWTPFAPAVAPGEISDPGAWSCQVLPLGARLWSVEMPYGNPNSLEYLSLP
jgi:hypothetical protein